MVCAAMLLCGWESDGDGSSMRFCRVRGCIVLMPGCCPNGAGLFSCFGVAFDTSAAFEVREEAAMMTAGGAGAILHNDDYKTAVWVGVSGLAAGL